MKQFQKNLLAAAVGSCIFASSAVYAEDAASISEALANGDTKLHFRLRYESADIDGTDKGQATTLKTRLTYTSGTFNGFGLTLEADDTTELVEEDYSTVVVNRGTAAIADPEVTEMNQAFVSYKTGGTVFKYGRQRILLDNQRFVGGVGWRQDEQTYDAFSISSKPTEGLNLFYAYVMDVNRIFAEAMDHDHETHLINASYDTPAGKIIGYGYLIDNVTAAQFTSDTLGVRWQGKVGDILTYNLEYATQSADEDGQVEYDADYMLAEVTGMIPAGESKIVLTGGYEVLGADEEAGKAFTTSLATLHAFQGWTDQFLATPGAGIIDTYFKVGTTVSGIKLAAVYHTYSADVGDADDFGTEMGFVVAKKFGPVGMTLKYSDYSKGDDIAKADTTKWWLMAAATF